MEATSKVLSIIAYYQKLKITETVKRMLSVKYMLMYLKMIH